MERRVVITGLGAITPIGKDVNESWNSILNKKCGIDNISLFDNSTFKTKVDAEVKITVENGTIHAIFDQVTSIRLYTISGLLLDTTDTTDYTQAVTKGLYILSVNGKPYKILVE